MKPILFITIFLFLIITQCRVMPTSTANSLAFQAFVSNGNRNVQLVAQQSEVLTIHVQNSTHHFSLCFSTWGAPTRSSQISRHML